MENFQHDIQQKTTPSMWEDGEKKKKKKKF